MEPGKLPYKSATQLWYGTKPSSKIAMEPRKLPYKSAVRRPQRRRAPGHSPGMEPRILPYKSAVRRPQRQRAPGHSPGAILTHRRNVFYHAFPHQERESTYFTTLSHTRGGKARILGRFPTPGAGKHVFDHACPHQGRESMYFTTLSHTRSGKARKLPYKSAMQNQSK